MAGDQYRRVFRGDSARNLPARVWNEVVDAARDLRDRRRGSGASASREPPEHTVIPVRNDTGADVPRWGILELVAPTIPPHEREDEFQSRVVLNGVIPTSTTAYVGVSLGPMAGKPNEEDEDKTIGRVVASGVVQCWLDVTDEMARRCGPAPGEVGYLRTGAGPIEILWRAEPGESGEEDPPNGGTDVRRAIVRLPSGGATESRLGLLTRKEYTSTADGERIAYTYVPVTATTSTTGTAAVVYDFADAQAAKLPARAERGFDVPVWPPSATGPLGPGIAVSDNRAGNVPIIDPDRALVSDDVRATTTLSPGEESHYLILRDFGATVTGAITAIKCELECSVSPGDDSCIISELRLVVAGDPVGVSQAGGRVVPANEGYEAFGPHRPGTWGVSLSPTVCSSPGFGFCVRFRNGGSVTRTISIDHGRITIYSVSYIEPLSVVRIRDGTTDYDLIDGGQQAWTDLFERAEVSDVDGIVAWHDYYDQDPVSPSWRRGREVRLIPPGVEP